MQHPRRVLPLLAAVSLLGLVGCGPAPELPTPTPSQPAGPTLPDAPMDPIAPVAPPSAAPADLAVPASCPSLEAARQLSGFDLATLETGTDSVLQCTYIGAGDPFDADRLLIAVEDQQSPPDVGRAVSTVGTWGEYIETPEFTELWVGMGTQSLHLIARPGQAAATLSSWAETLLTDSAAS